MTAPSVAGWPFSVNGVGMRSVIFVSAGVWDKTPATRITPLLLPTNSITPLLPVLILKASTAPVERVAFYSSPAKTACTRSASPDSFDAPAYPIVAAPSLIFSTASFMSHPRNRPPQPVQMPLQRVLLAARSPGGARTNIRVQHGCHAAF